MNGATRVLLMDVLTQHIHLNRLGWEGVAKSFSSQTGSLVVVVATAWVNKMESRGRSL